MLELRTRTRKSSLWRSLFAFLLTTAVVGVMGVLVSSAQAGASTAPTAQEAGRTVIASSTAMNWSGLVNDSYEAHYTEVAGGWTVPSVRSAPEPNATNATWVGIGGFTQYAPLIQTGTIEEPTGGAGTYYAWVAFCPPARCVAQDIGEPVHPGDEMLAEMHENSTDTWGISLEDTTQGWSYSKSFAFTGGSAGSAEWITERVMTANGGGSEKLADFGSTHFHDLGSAGSGLAHVISNLLYMLTTTGKIVAYPSVSSTGDSFTNYYGTPLPTVTSVSPAQGPASGGTTVRIKGTYLVPTIITAVYFGTTKSSTIRPGGPGEPLTARVPHGVSGTVNVTVVTRDGRSAISAADRFTYLPTPKVSSLSPREGAADARATVTITGSGFVPGATVRFGKRLATHITVVSSTKIVATNPIGTAGKVDVTVTTSGGTSTASVAGTFRYTQLGERGTEKRQLSRRGPSDVSEIAVGNGRR